jgi:hypothetical protein
MYFLKLLFTGKTNSNKMKNFTLFISILTLFVACNSGNSSSSDSSRENTLTVGEIERPKPLGVLEAGEMCISGFDGDSINIHGVIKNTSQAVSYKTAVVKVTYYNDAKEKLGNKEYTLHEVFPPHSDARVELKVENCKDVKTMDWEVVNAKEENQIK